MIIIVDFSSFFYQALKQHLDDSAELMNTFNECGQRLISVGFSNDPSLVKEISANGQKYHDATSSVDGLQEQVDYVMTELGKFEEERDAVDKDLTSLEEKTCEMNDKPVGGDPDEINNEIEEIKVKLLN